MSRCQALTDIILLTSSGCNNKLHPIPAREIDNANLNSWFLTWHEHTDTQTRNRYFKMCTLQEIEVLQHLYKINMTLIEIDTSCLFLQVSVQTYNKFNEAQTTSSEMRCNNNFSLWIFPIGSNQTWWGLRSGLSLERIVIGAAMCGHHERVRFSGGCFLRSPRRLRLRRCHSQEGSKENKLSETFYTKLCQPPRGSRRSRPSWLLSCARAPQSLGRGPDKRWPIRSLHFNYRRIRTHHQPVGEVGPHDGPAVASLVGVILLDVVRILICCVQDNNLIIELL